MTFYRYTFYAIYSFFERLGSPRAHNSALVVISVIDSIVILILHNIVNAFLERPKLTYGEIAAPYLVTSLAVFAANYLVLEHKLRYLSVEDRFKAQKHPRSFKLLLIVLFILVAASTGLITYYNSSPTLRETGK